jgi:hypothetical protein
VYKLSVHRATLDHTSANPDRPINLQIQPITAAGSVQSRSNGSQPSDALVHHARVHTVENLGDSLSSRRRFPLSHPISHFRPFEASEPSHKGFYPHIKQKPGRVQRFCLPIWPEKGTIFVSHRSFKPTILARQPSSAVDTTAIRILALRSTRINHFLAGNLARKFYRSNSNRA